MSKDKIVVFSAPSGAGKTSIIRGVIPLLKGENFNVEFSVSACSRKPRENEVHCKDYYFLSVEEFKGNIEKNNFLEWQEVYKDSFYGTLKSEMNRIWEKFSIPILDVDVLGALNVKKMYNEKVLLVFIMPPSFEILEKRLRERLTETPESIAKRIARAKTEIEHSTQFDKIVVNDKLENAILEVFNVVLCFLEK